MTVEPGGETLDRVRALVADHYGRNVRSAQHLPGEYDLNFRLGMADGSTWLLKVAPPGQERATIEFQHAMLRRAAGGGPDRSTGLPLDTVQGASAVRIEWDGAARWMHLLRWLPGRPWARVNPHTPELLSDLGTKLGQLSAALAGFGHSQAARAHEWDVARTAELVADRLDVFPAGEERDLATWFLRLFERRALPYLDDLPRAVNYNDANDWNIIVTPDGRSVRGFIDFGDAVETVRASELAIALAYAMMDKAEPLHAAALVARTYQKVWPLSALEIEVLFPLAGARLLLSAFHAAQRAQARPDNAYLQISRQQVWSLMRKLRAVSPDLAHYTLRQACGLSPHPDAAWIGAWIRENAARFQPVVSYPDPAAMGWIDLGMASTTLGNNRSFEHAEPFERCIRRTLEDRGWELAVGGYLEVRPFYSTDAYRSQGLEGPQWRSVHLGLDIWQAAGSPVFAPLDGELHSLADNRGERNYGPTIILKHPLGGGRAFYTLYGHLDPASLRGKAPGDRIAAGQAIGAIGAAPENGHWPPHLHWQILLDPLDADGDFPGVCLYRSRELWAGLCPDPALLQPKRLPPPPAAPPSLEEVQAARAEHLGPNLSLSYRKKLYMLRGYGTHLYDHTGRRYLDTVNNVAHVGHEHPRVVEALARQGAVLNTNTRYLHHLLPRYAARLLALFPEPLAVVYLVNSGSEANELALRMARTITRRHTMLAMETGYHGNTGSTIDVSAYKFEGKGGAGRPASTFLLPMPDPLRQPDAGALAALEAALQACRDQEVRPAGIIAESILSCGGQVVLPPGFLARAYAAVRELGGLCIADEVQTGFGRPGEHWWAFETQEVVPDIVTLGKPIGNGHPLGAVVCTRAVAEAFDNGMEYFNTFGGNPVSCAVGLAVLDVLEEEGLRENARSTGAYLRDRLRELQNRHPILGQVRGPGLFQGVELVRDRESLEPATAAGAHLIERMRRHGILMSTDGPYENVLKIKPPLVFGPAQADRVADTLDQVLREDYFAGL